MEEMSLTCKVNKISSPCKYPHKINKIFSFYKNAYKIYKFNSQQYYTKYLHFARILIKL